VVKADRLAEVVVDGGGGQGGVEVLLPSQHVARQAAREAFVAVAVDEEAAEADQVQGDLGGHSGRTHALNREVEVVVDPGGEGVGGGGPQAVDGAGALSGSTRGTMVMVTLARSGREWQRQKTPHVTPTHTVTMAATMERASAAMTVLGAARLKRS
jgi:hypothetical protein